ncbi:lactoylglutathione lyase [Anaerotaenia torta]|uniref:VOC family protein n=1 Tax=Anaerotaenia torta TaxID=433293 RepID=UPI003D1FE71F
MNFCWVTLHVGNFEKSMQFYHEILGLPVNSRHGGNGVEIAMLGEEGQAKIELLYSPENSEKHLQSDISIGIAVKSLEEAMDYLSSKQIPILRGPIAPNPHTRFLFIQDPDGYEVQLVEMK